MQTEDSSSNQCETIDELNEIISKGSSGVDYNKLIPLFMKQADNDRGITWEIKDDALIRNAANANGKLFSKCDYIVQMLNTHRAAIALIEINDNPDDGASNEIKSKSIELLTKYLKGNSLSLEKNCEKLLKQANEKILEILIAPVMPLSRYSWYVASKLLKQAEVYCGLEDKHYNIETHFEIGKKKFIRKETKIEKLTEEQLRLYEDLENQSWFKSLNETERRLVIRYKDQMKDGAHIIPTMLRNVPGARNAYKAQVLQVTNNQEISIGRFFHSGSIGTLSTNKDVSNTIPQQSFEQIKKEAKVSSNDELIFNSLCTEFSMDGEDVAVVKQTKAAVGTSFFNAPMNIFGKFSRNNVTQFIKRKQIFEKLAKTDLISMIEDSEVEDCVDETTSLVKKQKNAVREFLESNSNGFFGGKCKNALKAVENWYQTAQKTEEEKIRYTKLLHIIEFKRLVNKRSGISGFFHALFERKGSNINARITEKLATTLQILQGDESNELKSLKMLISCKSGKDRTGYLIHEVTKELIAINNPELRIADIERILIDGGHIQFLASCNGGKPGCFGIKPVAIDGDIASTKGLFCKPARYSRSTTSSPMNVVYKIQSVFHGIFTKIKSIFTSEVEARADIVSPQTKKTEEFDSRIRCNTVEYDADHCACVDEQNKEESREIPRTFLNEMGAKKCVPELNLDKHESSAISAG